jgi:hypothetical protein
MLYFRSVEFGRSSGYIKIDRGKDPSNCRVFEMLRYNTGADVYDDDPLAWCLAELSQSAYATPIFLPKVYEVLAKDRK